MLNKTKTFYDCCILKAMCETNGFQGGDAGHGGYLRLVLDGEGASMAIDGFDVDSVTLEFRGDAEMRVALKALQFFVESLQSELADRYEEEVMRRIEVKSGKGA